MSESKYFHICCSDDGDVSVREFSKEALKAMLNNRDEPPMRLVSKIPGHDPMYWDGQSIVIKGEIVVPVALDTVKEWEIP